VREMSRIGREKFEFISDAFEDLFPMTACGSWVVHVGFEIREHKAALEALLACLRFIVGG
jgi:hypothetical protein